MKSFIRLFLENLVLKFKPELETLAAACLITLEYFQEEMIHMCYALQTCQDKAFDPSVS